MVEFFEIPRKIKNTISLIGVSLLSLKTLPLTSQFYESFAWANTNIALWVVGISGVLTVVFIWKKMVGGDFFGN